MKHDALDFVTPPVPAGQPGAVLVPDRHWFKDAIVYELHVKAFADGNGDGIGDFKGLTSRLDYLAELGINTLWLLPFFPSPMRDDGYDVSDYNHVHPSFGTRNDFRQFVREAHARGLRVIIELIMNHTSDRHPWFQSARRAPAGSRKRAFYVWSDDPSRYAGTRIIFTDTETSNWTFDPVAQSYYWHRFFSHQPDLNYDNPHVLKAVLRTMRLWLDMGVDGFRLDAIPYLIEREGTRNENLPETHVVIKKIRAWLDAHYPDRVLLAEANQWPEDVRDYFGDGDECHMAYHFPLMPRMYMALAQEDRHPIVEIMRQTPEIPDNCQWAIFLRNHDELTLEMVTRDERDYMWRMYAAEPRARLNLGIRRRLAPLMDNDGDRIRLMNGLLLSMPGSPVLYYGDELGMGDNIFLGDRDGVRTPMQWSPDRNAGFSTADPQRLYLPPIMDAVYGYAAVNVESQQRDPSSLLNWTRRMLGIRRATPAFGRGTLRFLSPGNRKVLAFLREHGDEAVLCVANLSRAAQPVELDLAPWRGRVPVEMMGRTAFPPVGDLPYLLTLSAYGFFWFRLATDAPRPPWHEERLAPDDLPVMVLFDGWSSLFRDRVVPWRIRLAERTRHQLEREVLPRWLRAQNWWVTSGRAPAGAAAGSAAEPLAAAALVDHAEFGPEDGHTGGRAGLLALARLDDPAAAASAPASRWFLPLSIAWEGEGGGPVGLDGRPPPGPRAAAALAKVRQQADVGLLSDAAVDARFAQAVREAIADEVVIDAASGRFRFHRTGAFDRLQRLAADAAAQPRDEGVATVLPGLDETHAAPVFAAESRVRLADGLVLRVFRRVAPGPRPALEIARHLTDAVPFAHGVPVAGWFEHVEAGGTVWTLGLLEAPCVHQGDAWQRTLDYLAQHFDEVLGAARVPNLPLPPSADEVHGLYANYARAAGRRLAGLHLALAQRTGDRAFDPVPLTGADKTRLLQAVHAHVATALDLLARDRSAAAATHEVQVRRLVEARGQVLARIDAFAGQPLAGLRIRTFGDFRLGQLVVSGDDLRVAEVEGEPSPLVDAPGALHAPLRDLAALLHALSRAATAAVAQRGTRDGAERLAPLAAAWLDVARRAVLDGYWTELDTAPSGADLLPDRTAATAWLAVFEADRAARALLAAADWPDDWPAALTAAAQRLLDH